MECEREVVFEALYHRTISRNRNGSTFHKHRYIPDIQRISANKNHSNCKVYYYRCVGIQRNNYLHARIRSKKDTQCGDYKRLHVTGDWDYELFTVWPDREGAYDVGSYMLRSIYSIGSH